MVLSLCACGMNVTSVSDAQSEAKPAEAPAKSDATAEPVPTEEPVEEITSTQTLSDSPAKVVFYNLSTALDDELQALAMSYTEEKGVPVTVITVAEGYDDELSAALDSTDAPTIFSVNESNMAKWQISCLDLTGTAPAEKSVANELNFIDGEKLLGLVYDYECFGVGVNTRVLETANRYIDDIHCYCDFYCAVSDMQQLYYNTKAAAAFAEPALSGDMWRYTCYLINPAVFFECLESGYTEQPAYLRADFIDNVRTFYELWYSNTASSRWYLNGVDMSVPKQNFSTGKAAFYPCGSWELETFVNEYGANAADYAMIPMYMGIRNEEDYGLSCGRASWWCVNREASDNDIEAALDFLAYVAENGDGLAKIAAMPFDGLTCANQFLASSNRLLAQGLKPVRCRVDWLPGYDWEAACFDWLIKYTTGYGDWVQYTDQFIIGWQDGFAAQHTY